MISPEPEQPTDIYRLIREAIERKQQVLATYHGYYREMCPHALGYNKRGDAQALFYQFGGESSRPLGPPGSPENWRCIRIDELSNVSLRVGEWHTAGDHTRHETCVFHRLDLSITR
ncbi:MAG TPA: hypothetical protein VE951_01650 [Candidatus Angelobacter sp.]|jgi:hypothetical protein|nr:hypothetical protein [Candidatus Angelobacter sp.]